MSHEERLNNIKQEIEKAKTQRAKWEHELETTHATLAKLTTELSQKFGVTTVEQAKDLLIELNSELSKGLTETERLLERLRNDS